MNIFETFSCVYYNYLSNFYIILNYIFPYFEEEIFNLQYQTISKINQSILYEYNSRKKRRFNAFVENLIQKNDDFLNELKIKENNDNDINNYEKIIGSYSHNSEDSQDTENSIDSDDTDDSEEIHNKDECSDEGTSSLDETLYESKKFD